MLFALNQAALSSVNSDGGENPSSLEYLQIECDASAGILWNYIAKTAPIYFSNELLSQIRSVQNSIDIGARVPGASIEGGKIKYLVFGSANPEIYSLGGDLQLFRKLILDRDRAGLASYAFKAADAIYHHSTNSQGILTFSLVRGVALGGGFEAALAANVLVAERGSRLGFPEVLFGLFPGMGAYTFLKRRIGARVAKSIIESAKNYTAEELFELGIVDVLAEKNGGEQAIYTYISQHANRPGVASFRRAIESSERIDVNELYSIAELWVDTAMKLPSEYLRRIERLVSSQKKNYDVSVDRGYDSSVRRNYWSATI